jgi:hypothetical protein
MAFGNIIFGGIIGGAIDAGSGAAYDYPPLITVLMGENGTATPEPHPANNAPEKPSQSNVAAAENTNSAGVKTKDWSKAK